jgi:hypothetical protein
MIRVRRCAPSEVDRFLEGVSQTSERQDSDVNRVPLRLVPSVVVSLRVEPVARGRVDASVFVTSASLAKFIRRWAPSESTRFSRG